VATEISEALTALGSAALVQKVISPELLEYVRRYSPLVAVLPTTAWNSNLYYFNTRNALPSGGFVTDGGARPVSNSNYVQSSFTIRNLQTVGAVTGFAQEVTRAQIGDLLRLEMQGATKGLTWDIETGIDWGCAAATSLTFPQFDGLDVQISTFSGSTQNSIDAAGAVLTLGYLDQLIDIVESNAAEPIIGDDWMFVMSPRAVSTFSQALIPMQRYETVEVSPGIIVPTYRNIPLVKSSFLGAKGVAPTTVTVATATTGGTLAAGAYKYVISAVIGRYGETVQSNEVSQTSSGSTSTITLSFTPPVAIEGSSAISYRVFRTAAGGSAGTETLLGIVDANVGFMADGITPIVTTSIIDTGAALVPMNSSTAPSVVPTAYYNGNSGVLPRTAASTGNGGGEDIYLLSKNPDNVVRPYVRDIQPVPLAATTTAPDVLPFAMVVDTCLGIRAPKYASRLRNVVSTLTNANPQMHTVTP
jgi:hypothetical protein